MNSTQLYPLQFQPLYKYRMWGGNKLRTELGKEYEGENMGESWEISDVQGDETKVKSGHLAGYTLRSLAKEYKGAFLGKSVYEKFGNEFPLLIKFIDAKTPLSIQVHPHDHIAKERHNSFGKNEMWYVMDADEGAEIIVGFDQQIDTETYTQKLEEGNILEVMNAEKATAGDVFTIPTGRVHAIGAGVLLAEIQQTSDITYRIYDYNRVDKATGKTRELHNDLAIDVIDFEVHDSYKTDYEKTVNERNKMVHTPYFKSNILPLLEPFKVDYSELDSFVIHICTEGAYNIYFNDGVYHVKKGESILLPAQINSIEINPVGFCEILEVHM